ncbi:MAG: hypothetical protein ABIL01_19790 [Pseudomonadota bacterium]
MAAMPAAVMTAVMATTMPAAVMATVPDKDMTEAMAAAVAVMMLHLDYLVLRGDRGGR